MSDCFQLKENYEAYALGALDAAERAEVDAHLARQCPVCTPEVERARWLVSQLAYLAPEAAPPSALKKRVLESARFVTPSKPRSVLPMWMWAVAAAMILLVALNLRQVGLTRMELARLKERMRMEQERTLQLEKQREQYERILTIVSAPDTRTLRLQTKEAGQPPIEARWNEKLGVVLSAASVQSPQADRTYQLWIVPKKGAPISAGIFRPDAAGNILVLTAPETATTFAAAAALAVTNEPAGGRPTPTLPPLWAAAVTK